MYKDVYYKKLENDINDYNGEDSHLVKLTPILYDLINNIFSHSNAIDSDDRLELIAVIGYYINPHDIMNEDILGPIGYMDDLLLSISIVKKLKIKYGLEFLLEYWEQDTQFLEDILDKFFLEAKSKYSYEYNKIKQLLPKLFLYNAR